MEFDITLWAAVGFILAAYAVVGNDALQTLGTFINSNRHLHWTILFAFAALILVVTFTYGWQVNDGDPSYGRLANTSKYPPIPIEWYHVLPPAVLVIITRLGIPVSTSFMVLTIFATLGGLGSMIEKSLIGYGVAFVTGFGVYMLVTRTFEDWFKKNDPEAFVPYGMIAIVGTVFLASQYYYFGTISNINEMYVGIGCVLVLEAIGLGMALSVGRGLYWVVAQWATTAYLWSIWLIQDFANIFVFLPRELTAAEGFGAMVIILLLLGLTFANGGGPVQRILRTKTAVTDIRSATIVDFIYASLLFFFKELSEIPMSTTWVFLGLIAGREYAFAILTRATRFIVAVIDTGEDIAKAFIGIVLSIDLALGLPAIGATLSGDPIGWAELFPTETFKYLVIVGNVILLPVVWFAFSKPEDHPNRQKFIIGGIVMGMTLAISGTSLVRFVMSLGS
ncbi:hypothetical protein [Parvularcula marina]|uniref:hypothetical protein n=1 Tax=Parvularcula marina TaxID=2292771 RepID=UPI0018F2A82E|nr:hypothetical protein [Parvularcula marina]